MNSTVPTQPSAPRRASTPAIFMLSLGVCAAAGVVAAGVLSSLSHAEPGSTTRREAPLSLVSAVQAGNYTDAMRLLGDGVNPNSAQSVDQRSALLLAAGNRETPVGFVKELLVRGANPDACDAAGRTALFLAVESGNKPLVDLLLAAGANPQARSGSGETPASLAATQSNSAQLVALR